MARYRPLNGVQRPELNDPSVTAGEYNDLVNYPTLTLDEIRSKSIRGRQDLHDQRVQEATIARQTGGGRSGPLAGALRPPPTQATNAVADNSKPAVVAPSTPSVQTPTPGGLTDQSIPWADRKTANGRTTGLGGRVLESGAVETDQAAQSRILGTGTRAGGVAVRAVGDATPLNEAGSKLGNPLEALRYSPVQEPAGSPLPVTVYGKNAPTLGASNEAAVAPSTAAQPSALPSGPAVNEQVKLTPNPPVSTAPTPTATPALGSGGASVAAGVSNSQSAGFTTPTKDKPVPETPTTPVMNVDEYDKKSNRFSGFK